jgi:hypothetical protein
MQLANDKRVANCHACGTLPHLLLKTRKHGSAQWQTLDI